MHVSELTISNIQVDKRLRNNSPEHVVELAANIKKHGLLQPIRVRQLGPNEYRLVVGEHRLEAYKLNDETRIPAIIQEREETDELSVLKDQIAEIDENMRRHELTTLQRSKAIETYVGAEGRYAAIKRKLQADRELEEARRLAKEEEDEKRKAELRKEAEAARKRKRDADEALEKTDVRRTCPSVEGPSHRVVVNREAEAAAIKSIAISTGIKPTQVRRLVGIYRDFEDAYAPHFGAGIAERIEKTKLDHQDQLEAAVALQKSDNWRAIGISIVRSIVDKEHDHEAVDADKTLRTLKAKAEQDRKDAEFQRNREVQFSVFIGELTASRLGFEEALRFARKYNIGNTQYHDKLVKLLELADAVTDGAQSFKTPAPKRSDARYKNEKTKPKSELRNEVKIPAPRRQTENRDHA